MIVTTTVKYKNIKYQIKLQKRDESRSCFDKKSWLHPGTWMVLWHSCVNKKQKEKGMEKRRWKAPFFETYSLHGRRDPWNSIVFHRNLPSRQIVLFPCLVLSFTHTSFVALSWIWRAVGRQRCLQERLVLLEGSHPNMRAAGRGLAPAALWELRAAETAK